MEYLGLGVEFMVGKMVSTRDRVVWWWHIWNLFHCHISLNWFRFGSVHIFRVKFLSSFAFSLWSSAHAKNDKIKTLDGARKNRAKMRNNIKISKPGVLTTIANNSNSEKRNKKSVYRINEKKMQAECSTADTHTHTSRIDDDKEIA